MNQPQEAFDKARGDFFNVNRTSRTAIESDNRHVYGSGCSWNGPIAKIGTNGGLPACPHCRGMLFEMPERVWMGAMLKYVEDQNDPDYPKFIAWLSTRGTCSPLRRDEDLMLLRMHFVSLNLI